MYQKVSMRFVASTGAINFDFGFIPDEIFAIRDLDGGTNELFYYWHRVLADAENDGQYGFVDSEAGAKAACSDANNGFIPYTEGDDVGVMIEHPTSGKLKPANVNDYTVARSTDATARAATSAPAIGTVLRPSTHNGYVYECLTAGTGSAEPTWPTVPGDTVLDNDVLYVCRKEIIAKGGGQGITLGASLTTDTDEWLIVAEKHDRYEDVGDVDGIYPVKFSTN